MARRRKAYRNVRDQFFLEISNMPLVENRECALGWIKTSEVMEYVVNQAKNWKFLITVQLEDGGYVWQGYNYGKKKRETNRDAKTAYGEKVVDALIKDEIDLMPPLRHKFPNESYDIRNSQVVEFLNSKNNIINLILVTAAYNGLVIRLEDGSWHGVNVVK